MCKLSAISFGGSFGIPSSALVTANELARAGQPAAEPHPDVPGPPLSGRHPQFLGAPIGGQDGARAK